jgi:hypothetical protein
LSGAVIERLFETGHMIDRGPATAVFVESLLRRGAAADVRDAHAAIDRLAAVPIEPGFVLHELPLLRLRALLARARGDETGYCDYRQDQWSRHEPGGPQREPRVRSARDHRGARGAGQGDRANAET